MDSFMKHIKSIKTGPYHLEDTYSIIFDNDDISALLLKVDDYIKLAMVKILIRLDHDDGASLYTWRCTPFY